MKKRAEIAIAALAVMFICFSLGYFTGRRSVPSEVSILQGTVIVTPTVTSSPEGGDSASAAESLPPSAAPSATPAAQASATPDEPSAPPPSTEIPVSETSAPKPSEPAETAPLEEPHYTSDGLLRINYATAKELETLPGIGEVLASRIIEYRDKNGPFSRLTTLKVISGIGDARYNAIKDLITVE